MVLPVPFGWSAAYETIDVMAELDPDVDGMVRVFVTREVFVAGGTPTTTYNPRQASKVEQQLNRFLDERSGKALTIYGPSKSGKTSLVENKLPKSGHVWLQGQDVRSIDDFWQQIAAQVGIPNSLTVETSSEQGKEDSYGGGLGVAGFARADLSSKDSVKSGQKDEVKSEIHLAKRVRDKLALSKIPVIIDDFHYMPDMIKRETARAIKSIIRESPVILIAVPSEAFEVVRKEPEMNMRVWSIQIPPWDESELAEIAERGFSSLNLSDPDGLVAERLARVSYASPYIMQQLCYDTVRWEMGIEETVPVDAPVTVSLPLDFDTFLAQSAERAQWAILPKLLAGPAGSNRVPLFLGPDKIRTDIYGAVLVAIKNLTPPLSHSERQIYQEVNRILTYTVQGVQVTNALDGMHKIAERERGESDPVLRRRDGTLFIEDSGFAFYLNHGPWSPEKGVR